MVMQSNDDTEPVRRGRPRRFVPPRERRHLLLEEPLAALSPTAFSMLDAGRRILAEHGFHALTVEAVVNDAGVSRATFAEHFGDRVGFLAILFDSLTHDPSVALEVRLADSPSGAGRCDSWVMGLAGLYEDVESCVAYQSIAAGALHDPPLRRRLVELLAWYRSIGVSRLSACEGAAACTADELATLAGLLEAAEDGLALRKALDPENFDVDRTLAMLARLVGAYLAERLRQRPDLA